MNIIEIPIAVPITIPNINPISKLELEVSFDLGTCSLSKIVIDSENLTKITEHNNHTMEISENEPLSQTSDNSDFEIGLLLGIIIGAAIGISMIFIFRQKNT